VILFLVLNASFSSLFLSSWRVSALESEGPLYIKDRALLTDTPSIYVFAEVINNGTVAVRNVNVTVTFYDNQSRIIEEYTSRVWLEVILPHRRAPVVASITGQEKVSQFYRYKTNITSYELYPEGEEASILIDPNTLQASLSSTNATVAGNIINNGSTAIKSVQVIAIFYDEKGIRAAEADTWRFEQPLPPGSETDEPFVIESIFVTSKSERVACILTAESIGGIGVKKQTIDKEILFWLKGNRTITHEINVDGHLFYVTTESNSTVEDMRFSGELKKISLDINGIPDTTGFCNVTIPVALLEGPYSVEIDNSTIFEDYNPPANGTHTFIYLTYNHTSPHTVDIIGTKAFQVNVGKFDFRIIALLILGFFTVASVIVIRKKTHRKPHRRRQIVKSQQLRFAYFKKPTSFYFFIFLILIWGQYL